MGKHIRFREDTGATLVEAAIILPVLILLVVTIMELGLAFKDFLTTDFAAKEGARVGALSGNDVDADCYIVRSIVSGYSANDLADLDHIEIYQVSEATGNKVPGTTNRWSYVSGDPLDCESDPAPNWAVTVSWPSVARNVEVGSTPLDIIGVTVDTQHDWITGVPPWNGQMTILRTAIQRLEPEAFE
jgi:Flp pilus assembly protein TadG